VRQILLEDADSKKRDEEYSSDIFKKRRRVVSSNRAIFMGCFQERCHSEAEEKKREDFILFFKLSET